MKGLIRLLVPALLLTFTVAAQAQEGVVRPPAQYKSAGNFSGGAYDGWQVISGVRFGTQDEGRAIRMVLDLESCDQWMQSRAPSLAHPRYTIELHEYPYRLVIRLDNVLFDPALPVASSPALPFSVVTADDGRIRELQVFLSGPSEFKVIEIDDPAKLSIDVRPIAGVSVPDIYTVQITDATTPEHAFALIENGGFPEQFQPSVLVLGHLVVLEQAFTDMATAARLEASLRQMGYSTVINERRGNELPLP